MKSATVCINYLYKILTCYSRRHSHFNCTLAHTPTHTHTHARTHTRTYTHTHTHTHTQTRTCLQPPLHHFTQCQHLWVASDCCHNVTDSHQCVQSALSSQAQMQLLILSCWVPSTCDVPLIAFINDIVMQKVTNNSLGIHFLNEPAPKLVQDFFS